MTTVFSAVAGNATFTFLLPNESVSSIVEDAQGFIWLGTEHGLCRYSGSNCLTYYASQNSGDLQNDNIQDLYYDAYRDILWVSTECGLSYRVDGEFHHQESAVYNPIMKILSLDRDNIVVTARDGIAKVTKDGTYVTRYYKPGLSWVTNICVSSTGEIWFTYPMDGVIHLMVLNSDMIPVCDYPLDEIDYIYGQISCPDNTVWVSTDKGIYVYNATSRRRIETPSSVQDRCSDNQVSFLSSYGSEGVLIGMAGDGMYVYNIHRGSLERLYREQRLEASSYSCLVDSHLNIWLTDGENGIMFYPSVQQYIHISPSGFSSSNCRNISFDDAGIMWLRMFSHYGSYDIVESRKIWDKYERSGSTAGVLDSRGDLWTVEDHNKLCRFSTEAGVPSLVSTQVFDNDIASVLEDADGNIWICNSFECLFLTPEDISSGERPRSAGRLDSGSFSMSIKDIGSGEVYACSVAGSLYRCTTSGLVPVSFSGVKSISNILTASDGTVWIGTFNAGLVHYSPQVSSSTRYDTSTGLVSSDIRAILEDPQGDIWFSTPQNIIKYERSSDRFVTLHDSHLSSSDFYNLSSAAISPDGVLYFGAENGITAINYRTVLGASDTEIPLFFQTITINGVQATQIPENLTLSHKDKVLTFLYAGLNFESGSLLNYSYLMEGYEKEWHNSTSLQASYTNLPPGRYRFRVRVRLMNGSWSKSELDMPVRVKPSVWNCLAAKILYALLAVMLVWFVFRTTVNLKLKDERIALAEKQEEISRSHADFLANVSHEIRTPLSLIYAPVKELLKSRSLSEHDKGLLSMMERNAEILNNLSSTILDDTPRDIKKEEVLKVASVNLSNLALYSSENFRYAATGKDISLSCDIQDGVAGWVDREKVEKILYNFLSNAIKYTPEHGDVCLSLVEESGRAIFRVSDTGPGISEEKLGSLFGRHNRLGAEQTDIPGHGIGLNYAMYLSQLHKGEIRYEQGEQTGSVFILEIPIGEDAYTEAEKADFVLRRHSSESAAVSPKSKDAENIVVAEDNADVRAFLRELLSTRFNVTTCEDGEQAFQSVEDTIPDLILSDIIMPRKDGFALCREIKSDPDYCHIPVVLLTAKNDSSTSVSSMESGADAFVAKPFDPDYLVATVNALLENRRRIQQRVLSLTSSTINEEMAFEDSGLTRQEKAFLEKTYKIIDDHLADESFSVEALASELAVSYSSLYAKVKAITGSSPLSFLNAYRMNVAMEMLKRGGCSVAEVADAVGASSPFNFSRDFKKHFGVPPSSVKED